MKTPNVQYIVDDLVGRFDVHVGHWACRRIAGTLTWSQHAYTDEVDGQRYEGNAADVFGPVRVLDDVAEYLRETYQKTTAHILWRVKNHFDHVHFDTWPQGNGLPPCKGGNLHVVHRDLSQGRHFTYNIEDEMPLNEDDKNWISGEIARQLKLVNSNISKVPGKTWAHGDKPDDPNDVSAWQFQIRTNKNTNDILKEIT